MQPHPAPAVSERRACRVIGRPRSTRRYTSKQPNEQEQRLVQRMHELVRHRPRYGYRRIGALLRREGRPVNIKRIHRLWKQEHIKVLQKQHNKRHPGSSRNSIIRRRGEHRDHVWCRDFIHDSDARGRPLKWLSIGDEFTRERLALELERSIRAPDVVDVLAELFLDLPDAQAHAARRRNAHNHRRPHSSLGHVPPAAFAATLGGPPVGAAPLPPARPARSCYPFPTLIVTGT
jgi:transposase InsO family protein